MPYKTVATLLTLVEGRGDILTRDELMKKVWPDKIAFEQSNLAHHIKVLRRMLGDDPKTYIETVPKRGYRFVAAVTESWEPDLARAEGSGAQRENAASTCRGAEALAIEAGMSGTPVASSLLGAFSFRPTVKRQSLGAVIYEMATGRQAFAAAPIERYRASKTHVVCSSQTSLKSGMGWTRIPACPWLRTCRNAGGLTR